MGKMREQRPELLAIDEDGKLVSSGDYQIENGIIIVEGNPGVDLRISSELLNIHNLRFKRRFYDRFINSDVEYYARLHSVEFTDLHAELLSPYLKNAVVADAGCGQMPYGTSFRDLDIAAYYAFDLDRASLDIAKQNNQNTFPTYFVQNGIDHLPLPSVSVDAVVSSEVIEHVDDPMSYLLEMRRICKPGGHLSISTPCASMYLYPHNLIGLLRRPSSIRQWWRQMNAHECWDEALAWHPGLRPAIFRRWLQEAGFEVVRHETRLWYYGTPIRPAWRIFASLEQLGLAPAGKIFALYLKSIDKALASGLPVIRWAGIRQFALCRRPL